MKMSKIVIIFSTICLLVTGSSVAGSKKDQPALIEPEKIATFAKEVERYTAEKGALAFIVARVGRPEKDLPKGIHFTHTAVAVYSNIQLDSGEVVQGYAIHNLYQSPDQPEKSELITDYPVDFFWGAQTLKAGIIIPTPEIQLRLIEMIASGENKQLHNENYSVIANPFNQQFQNCTEHTLDMLNAAIYKTTDIAQLKVNTKAHFAPQKVHTSRFKLMFGSMLMDDVTMKDHRGKIVTTTFGSINRYLKKYDLTETSVTLLENGEINTI